MKAKEALAELKKYCVSDLWLYENKADEDIKGCDEAVEYNEAVETVEQALTELEELKKVVKELLDIPITVSTVSGTSLLIKTMNKLKKLVGEVKE